ncbi:MAG: alpha/beta fold hydrolase [Polyangiaceae bacterium]
MGGSPVQLEVKITSPTEAFLSIPAAKVVDQPVLDLEYSTTRLAFRVAPPQLPPGARPRFDLTRGPDGTARGTLVDPGGTTPVRLHLLRDGEHAGDRPQTPKPPYPYDERAAEFESKGGTRLAGTLTLPKSGGPHPAIVLISGTGPQDRDETLYEHRPFRVLADHLTRAGVAVLRLDDRGVGGSQGDSTTATEDDKAADALAAMAWLSTQPGIDAKRIGLLGHSEGGVLAAMAASRANEPSAAFVVLFASPGVPASDLLRTQMRLKLEAAGATKDQLDISMKAQNDAIDAVLRDASDADLERIVTAQIDGLLAKLPEEERKRVSPAEREGRIKAGLAQITAPSMKAFIKSTPSTYLEKLTCPVLAIGGTKDLQVPATENLAAIDAALKKAGNRDVTTQSFDGLNHLFQRADLGTMEEWATIDETLDPRVLEALTGWLTSRTGLVK